MLVSNRATSASMYKQAKNAVSAALCVAGLAFGAGAASAQQLDNNVSCIAGDVPAYEWAELTAYYKESIWDRRAAMRLVSGNTRVLLSVTDDNGEELCDDTANMTAVCRFRFPAAFNGNLNIRVDNTAHEAGTPYTLCAE